MGCYMKCFKEDVRGPSTNSVTLIGAVASQILRASNTLLRINKSVYQYRLQWELSHKWLLLPVPRGNEIEVLVCISTSISWFICSLCKWLRVRLRFTQCRIGDLRAGSCSYSISA